jgi:hypothetical protein
MTAQNKILDAEAGRKQTTLPFAGGASSSTAAL